MLFRVFPFAILVLIMMLFGACAGINGPAVQNGIQTLEGPQWTPVELLGQKVSGAADGEPPFMQLRDGQVSGFASCNRFFGRYTLDGTMLRFEGVAATRMFCADTMQTEDAFLSVLSQTDGYELEDGRLRLYNGERTLGRFELKAGG